MDKLHKIKLEEKERHVSPLAKHEDTHVEPKLIGEEVFLQKIFAQDARQGCETLLNGIMPICVIMPLDLFNRKRWQRILFQRSL